MVPVFRGTNCRTTPKNLSFSTPAPRILPKGLTGSKLSAFSPRHLTGTHAERTPPVSGVVLTKITPGQIGVLVQIWTPKQDPKLGTRMVHDFGHSIGEIRRI